jgi:bifunctional non-homologous end joining protein LigD
MARGALGTYRRKRRFAKTPEPRGGVIRRRRPRGLAYVIQKHDATRLHFDLRLELDGVMKSWAVPRGPSLDPKVKRMAVQVEDHPIDYNRFEGVIPRGEYGGGPVLIWDRGVWIPEGDARAAYRKGALKFRLEGEKLHGSWVLVRTRQRQGSKEQWLLIKHRDDAARPDAKTDIVVEAPRSVVSGRTIEEIGPSFHRRAAPDGRPGSSNGHRPARTAAAARSPIRSGASLVQPGDLPGARRAPLPAKLLPELATLVDQAPAGREWLHEIKYDGYRALCRIAHGKARIFTRRGNDWTDRFASIARAVTALPVREAWLDGEIVVLTGKGTSSFPALVDALGDDTAQERLVDYLFDLPYLDGFDLQRVPLEARKQALERIVRAATSGKRGPIRYSDHIAGNGRRFFQEACRAGLEGIIAKRAGSLYREGRGRDWLKVKCLQTRELAIVGYTEPAGSRKGFGALVLGEANDGRMVHVGRVGTGFTDRMLQDLLPRLEALEVETPPVEPAPRGAAARGVHWVAPKLVADVAFMERTRDGILRHPTFRGLREDKSPPETRGEAEGTVLDAPAGPARSRSTSAASAGPRLTHPDKVLYPEDGITKRRLADYYLEVQDRLMPYLKDRPLTVYRCPEGVGRFCFWEKHRAETLPRGLRPISLDDAKTEKQRGPYFYATSIEGILALVQLGTLEFHVWGSRASKVEYPDLMIFDIDPDVGLAWTRVVEACLTVRGRLEELGLRSWLKTTGGKGLHVCVPLGKRQDWDEVKAFAKALSDDVVRREPLRYTANLPKARRKGRIFIDYLRNGRGATAIAAYSTRARKGAPVSMPLAWDELEDPGLRPDRFTVANAPERLRRKDPWTGFDVCRQTITAAMRRRLSE